MSLKLEGVCHIYQPGSPYETTALKDINLEIHEGEFVAIIGHTGSGKSTLIQHFNALLKPTSGKVTVDGIEIGAKGVKLKEIRQKVGLVFQYPEHQLFEETVYEDIAFGPKTWDCRAPGSKRVKSNGHGGPRLCQVQDSSPFVLSGKAAVAIAGYWPWAKIPGFG